MPLGLPRTPALVDAILLLMLFIWFGGSALLMWLATRRDQPMLVAGTRPVAATDRAPADRATSVSTPLAAPAQPARV